MDLSERAYDATMSLLRTTSNAPHSGEIAKALEQFALAFASDVGARLVRQNGDDSLVAVRNAVDRASKGEP